MTMRCLLIRSLTTGRLYLVDNGAGNKFNDKCGNHGLSYGEQPTTWTSLARAEVQPSEITDLIFTHLFDHCGGTTDYVDGVLSHVFPTLTIMYITTTFARPTSPTP